MPHVDQPGLALPPGRYGTSRRAPRWVIVALIAVAAVLVIPILVSAADKATPDVRGTLTRFWLSDNEAEVVVDIHKPADRVGVCSLEARNRYSDVVGTAEIVLTGPTTGGAVRRTFPTSEKAVVVEVLGCTARPAG